METGRITLNEDSQAQWNQDGAERLRYEYDLSPDDLVIDIGAHEGQFSQAIYDRYKCKVIAIEPTGFIDKFKEGEVINKAASDHDGYESFGGLSLYTSIYEPASHRYPCFDICSLLEKYSDIGLVKMNIEGGEYKLLNHILSKGMQARIRNLQVQFHQVEGEAYTEMHEAIQVEMAKTHHLTYFYPFCWENWQRD